MYMLIIIIQCESNPHHIGHPSLILVVVVGMNIGSESGGE